MPKIAVKDIQKKMESVIIPGLNDEYPEIDRLKTSAASLVKNLNHNVKILLMVSKKMLQDYPEGHSDRGIATYNYCSLIRLAEVLKKLEKGQKEVEISEMEHLYFASKSSTDDVMVHDFSLTSKGKLLNTPLEIQGDLLTSERQKKVDKKKGKSKKSKKKEEVDDEKEEVDDDKKTSPIPAVKEVMTKANLKIFLSVFVVAFLLMFVLWPMYQNYQASSSQVFPISEGYNQSDDVSLDADESFTFENNRLSSDGQALLSSAEKFKSVVSEEAFLVLVLLIVGGLILLAFDRTFDSEMEDFFAAILVLLVYTILINLVNGQITVGNVVVGVDYVLTAFIAVIFGFIGWLGNKDFTVVSVGLYIAGIILFVSDYESFMAWSPPTVSLVTWSFAFLVHLLELVRQENTIRAFVISAIASGFQVVAFLMLASSLKTATDPLIADHVQLISFSAGTFGTFLLIVISLFLGMKTDVFKNINGIQNTIETEMFDVAVLANLFGGLAFLLYVWV